MRNDFFEKLGTPDITLAGLTIWITGRQYDDSTDFWDGNWLLVVARCASEHSEVRVSGPLLHLSEMGDWASRLRQLSQSIQGEAALDCMEPELDMSISLDRRGSGTLVVSITPGAQVERHVFTFPIDQSYLGPAIAEIQMVLNTYPVRGSGKGKA